MDWLRKIFTENVGTKLLALALAIGLWAAIGSDPVTEAVVSVPVEFVNVPRNLEVVTGQPVVQLWARGPSHLVRQASPPDFSVRVNAATVSGPGEHTFSLEPGSVVTATPLQVVELIPSELRVTLEESVVRDVPIHPNFFGEPLPGYRVSAFQVSPAQAQIAGPRSRVNLIQAASTDPIDLSRIRSSRTFVSNLSGGDPLVRFTQPKAVQVSVEIEKTRTPDTGGQP